MVQEFRRRSTLHYRKLALLGPEVSCHLGKDMLLSISENYRNFKFSNNVTFQLSQQPVVLCLHQQHLTSLLWPTFPGQVCLERALLYAAEIICDPLTK